MTALRPTQMMTLSALLTLALLFSGAAIAADGHFTQRADVQQFIDKMVRKHQFDRATVTQLLSEATLKTEIIKAITRPYESKPWYQYRPIFVTEKRIARGLQFWRENSATLLRAEEQYGVPPEIITAIIGVESFYGRYKGRYRVLDSLVTLGFDYPRRGKFFRSELEHYLLMTRDEKIDPRSMKGSYAGAMGQPQFIASSYREYAVDFNNDGRRDLWNNTDDAIGSVAHYFRRHGWQQGAPIASRASVSGSAFKKLIRKRLKPEIALDQLIASGVTIDEMPDDIVPTSTKATLIELKTRSGHEYWVGYRNFYVISRYNHSALYSMAVFQLATELRKQRDAAAVKLN
ncbi:MAG TPA: lytic murein transglycosylase B [Chromatiales bacterium]|nr:lytic murein transglycosylase B [Chromatiales bacterium]